MADHDNFFPRLPSNKNKTKAIHAIGKIIAKRRIEVSRSDIHSRPLGKVPLQLFNSSEFETMDRLFVLPQRDVISVCHSNYGKAAESRRPTTDDKVHALGISMTIKEIRELIPDMLGKKGRGTFRAGHCCHKEPSRIPTPSCKICGQRGSSHTSRAMGGSRNCSQDR